MTKVAIVLTILLLSFDIEVRAKDFVHTHNNDAQKSMDNLAVRSVSQVQDSMHHHVNNIVSNLFERALTETPSYHSGLDKTALGKPSKLAMQAITDRGPFYRFNGAVAKAPQWISPKRWVHVRGLVEGRKRRVTANAGRMPFCRVVHVHELPVIEREEEGRRSVKTKASRVPFERFDSGAVMAVKNAFDEAERLGSPEVGSEHLLLAITRRGGRASESLKGVGVNPEAVERVLRGDPGSAEENSPGIFGNIFGGKNSGVSGDDLVKARAPLMAGASADKPFSKECQQVLKDAEKDCLGDCLTTPQLALAIARADSSQGYTVLQKLGCDVQALQRTLQTELRSAEVEKNKVKKEREKVGAGRGREGKKTSLEDCGTDLTEQARNGELDPVVGREDEIARLLRVLLRRRKCNPCLLGDPGVGKTAVVEGFAQKVAAGEVPNNLKDCRVVSLQLGLLVADTKYRGEFEERLKSVLEEATKDKNLVLFIDELHLLIGAGTSSEDGGMDAANLMKPALARGELRCIGATTVEEYRRYVEKDAALERRFQPLTVSEPSPGETREILEGLSRRYENHHGVRFSGEALDDAVRLAVRYIPDRFLPDKAIDVVDEAGALAQMNNKTGVSSEEIAKVVAQWTGVPVERMTSKESIGLLELENTLQKRVIGQTPAVRSVSKAVRRARAGLRKKGRPLASLLFAGPTGVGKTELVKSLVSEYYGTEDAMVRIDMSEYMEPHTVSRLVGPPPGYIGFEQGGQLTDAVRRKPHCLVLFDEMEKAHPDVFNILLQVLEDGRLTDGKGRVVDFSNAMLIFTSNIGSRAILASFESMGADAAAQDIQTTVRRELTEKYRPEFLNRLDEIVAFEPLTKDNIREITTCMVRSVTDSLTEQKIGVETTKAFQDRLVTEGFSPQYGARPLRRAVQCLLEDSLAEALISGFIAEGNTALIDVGSENRVKLTVNGRTTEIAVDSPGGIESSDSTSRANVEETDGENAEQAAEFLAQAMVLSQAAQR